MKRLSILSVLMIAGILCGYSQTDTTKGISFEHNLSWQEVLQKAKKENKYVFVDCYATWCGPCKWMDRNIYPIDSVGTFMNDRFISVRMQMDTNKQDNDEIRQWYATARAVGEEYHFRGYPSYLFFSPDGQAVHKGAGEKGIEDFLSMAKAALDPQQQYYTLLADYRKDNMSYSLMPVLANAAQGVGQDSLAKEVSRDYIQHYLEMLPEEQLWTKANILFIVQHSDFIDLEDKIFQVYYRNRMTINSVMHDKQFSDWLINYILYRDEVMPQVNKALKVTDEPNWHHLEMTISRNYNVLYAQKNVIQGRVEYYKAKKRWKNYIKCFIRQQEMNGIESWQAALGNTSFILNNDAYEVFKYDNNKRELKKALSWVNRALAAINTPYPPAMDTKANLLYKLGKKSEGLTLEKKSHDLLPRDKEIAANYEKMKSELPTWVTQ